MRLKAVVMRFKLYCVKYYLPTYEKLESKSENEHY